MLKPKQPTVVATPVSIRLVEIGIAPILIIQATLGIDVFIKNRNYAGFKYGNSNTSVYYRGNLIGQAPIPAGEINARSTQNISTIIDLEVGKVITNPNFLPDVLSGMLNFTSGSTMVGDVILVKVLKLHATTSVDCGVTVFIKTKNSTSSCASTIKI